MMAMTLAQARRDHEIGYLTTWRIERAPMGPGWVIHLGQGMGAGYLVDARSKQPRVFSSLDSCVRVLRDIGFGVDALFAG